MLVEAPDGVESGRRRRADRADRLAVVVREGGVAVGAALEQHALGARSGQEARLGVRVEGLDPMWFVRWSDAGSETRFLSASRAAGVLFKRGAYDYAALAHDDDEAITAIGHAAAAGFDAVRKLDAE